MRSLRSIVLLIVTALFLLSCDDEDGDTRLATPQNAPLATPPGEPPIHPPTPHPIILDKEQALLYVQGGSIYLFRFSDRKPELVAERVGWDPPFYSPYVDPSHQFVLYSEEGRPAPIYHVDLVTLETRSLLDLSSPYVSNWSVNSVSPNGEWVILDIGSHGMILASANNPDPVRIGSAYANARWLTNGNILLTDSGSDYDAYIYDISSRKTELIETDSNTLQDALVRLDEEMVKRDIAFAEPSEERETAAIVPPASFWAGNSSFCETWRIVQYDSFGDGSVETELYSADGIYELWGLRALSNGARVFLQATTENCRVGVPQVELIWLLDQESKTITDDVFPGVSLGRSAANRPGQNAFQYSVSPGGRYIVWIGGNLEKGYSELKMLDLETEATDVLLREDKSSGADSTFVNDRLFRAVYWIGP